MNELRVTNHLKTRLTSNSQKKCANTKSINWIKNLFSLMKKISK